jgi:hypothetical protein
MSTQQNNLLAAEASQAEKLCGFTVVETIIDDKNNSWGLLLMNNKGVQVRAWIDCDPEGNGPGHINLEWK